MDIVKELGLIPTTYKELDCYKAQNSNFKILIDSNDTLYLFTNFRDVLFINKADITEQTIKKIQQKL